MYQSFKRLLDFLIALFCLPLLIITGLIVAPLIYFDDRGPVFYNALRAGKNFKEFKMYKFRTMKVNAPDIRTTDGGTYNSDNDPRVTRIGKFLRKTSIDELPQLLNVLAGNMSIVGPRPILPVKDKSTFTDFMLKRMDVRPGITGYSQAYFRNSIPRMEKYRNDAYYAEHESFLFDIKIILKTLKTVLKKENINRLNN
ncbi:UDP-phosphate galactose phosphotransferase [Bacteroidia bacterium]|nr:UDP-phosphate galactose phosphotransferase [Bacteroidia bacterium]